MAEELVWKAEYSVGVKEIDEQHQGLFRIINRLVALLGQQPTAATIDPILAEILKYKKEHFATEERYFKLYNYDKADEHIAQHAGFNQRVEGLLKEYQNDSMGLAFTLVDFLEDWLLSHLMVHDQQYVACFRAHGLK